MLEATDLDWKAIEARSGAGPRSGSFDLGKTLPESSRGDLVGSFRCSCRCRWWSLAIA